MRETPFYQVALARELVRLGEFGCLIVLERLLSFPEGGYAWL